ncbi:MULTISPECIES: hypothetical protein [Bradyrhizobium]|uniref:hypothetical protein n=1 Tax=Bradyrhizobium TaxID=374 RepID=UPI0003FD40C4|nr:MULTISPECIES: hypothetical protein [Bradyrhizobium]MBR0884070.1 hypothetical protein [Bradyrhizobium liaoningense]MBR1004245.1 hypothetical protein [Bradyrhizobium liaoningense]MBR1070521.1 hypothetical protein [Bradyrhizobium liaoningense]MCP1741555.1 hypothetical protein [Bradyrhizobium japonicum]MCP1779662.1 hypothetical protein [Bradyrhizobium japonicum]
MRIASPVACVCGALLGHETPGRTKEEVLAFMEQAAAAIEAQINPRAPEAAS